MKKLICHQFKEGILSWGIYISLQFKKQDGVNLKEEHTEMEAEPYEKDMEDVLVDD